MILLIELIYYQSKIFEVLRDNIIFVYIKAQDIIFISYGNVCNN